MSDLISIILLSSLGGLVALIAGAILLSIKGWSKSLEKYSIPFSAGVMVTVAFLGLLPEAHHMLGENAFMIALLALLGSYLFETVVFDLHHHDHCEDPHHDHHSSSALVIVGDTIHNFIDGVAIAAAYLINPGLGLITAISTLLHEVPHEIGDFGILLKNGFSKKKVFWINLVSSLSAILGAMFVYFFVVSTEVQGMLMAIAAGMFIYLGASDFLPKADKGINKVKAIGVLLLGVLSMFLTLKAIPHEHNHEDGHEDHSTEEVVEENHNDYVEMIEEGHGHEEEEDHAD